MDKKYRNIIDQLSRDYKIHSTYNGRKCSKCRKFKNWSDFDKKSRGKNGRDSRCKQCISEIKKRKYKSKKRRIQPMVVHESCPDTLYLGNALSKVAISVLRNKGATNEQNKDRSELR